jgi:hypothetical protein
MTIPAMELGDEQPIGTMKRCTLCKSLKPFTDFTADKSAPDGRRSRCKRCHADVENRQRATGLRKPQRVDPVKHRERVRREAVDFAQKVYAHYGRECACCGTTEQLTIDHIDGRGREHRLEVFGRPRVDAVMMYRWLIRNGFPDGFQVLCQPCNASKARGDHCRIWHGEAGFDRCARCEQVLPLSAFGLSATGRKGHTSWCKPCLSEYEVRKYDPQKRADRHARKRAQAND